ncbi:hypothetical protein EV426DRAFT_573804 [Tirmania nivea]|nr:hypothetical protein EV426DRAFT_573804 [Tirmania nivea]
MKFTAILLFSAALITGAAAQTKTTTSSAPVNTNSSYGADVDNCLKACSPDDAYASCAATCLGNPNPTREQVNETTKCAAACPQGNGTKEETEAYGKCQRECTVKYFLPNPDSVPSSGPSQTDGTSAPTATDSNGNRVNSTSSSTSTSTTSTPTNGASTMVYSASFAGVAAAFAAFFAL